jgi:CheY-like chemotaxis protein
MKLEYRILWFDDDQDLVNDYKPDLERFLEELGFSPRIDHFLDGRDLEKLLLRNYDLIMTDLNLGEHETGQKLIEKIRSNQIYTEVLFYSGNDHEINEIMEKEKWVERVSVAVGIENLTPKARDLIRLTVIKFQDINAMRGMVMAETSDLDVTMKDVIFCLLNSFGEGNSEKHKVELLQKVIVNRKERLAALEEISVAHFDSIIKELTSYDRFCAIKRLVKSKQKDIGPEPFSKTKSILDGYNEEIINKRNILAHAKETENEYGVRVVKSDLTGCEITIDDEFCGEIRKNIKKHKENFEELISILPQHSIN